MRYLRDSSEKQKQKQKKEFGMDDVTNFLGSARLAVFSRAESLGVEAYEKPVRECWGHIPAYCVPHRVVKISLI